MMKHLVPTAAALLALVTVGCDSPGMTSKTAKSPTTGHEMALNNGATPLPDGEGFNPNAPQTPTVFTPGLAVSEAIAKACGIPPRADGKSAPSFEFDSAALGQDDREMLGQIAKCLTEGALKGRSVRLVGRADPRGEQEYNMNLGSTRANSVFNYMQGLGVAKDKMNLTSRGELDATGKDEAGWAKDRRVDVELAN